MTIEQPLQPGETREVEIRLEPAGTIDGLLRINGEPSPGIVRCRAQGKDVARAWARPDGRFEIRGVPPGQVALQAFPDEYGRDGYTPYEGGHTHPLLAEVEVVAGETKSVDLDLVLSMGTIRGRVTSPSGKPRAHVSVSASAGRGYGNWQTVTAADGSFELRVPAECASYQLNVQDGPPVAASPNAEDIEIVRAGNGRVRLRAEDSASHGTIEGASLFVRRGAEWESWGGVATGTNGFVEWELEAGTLELALGKPHDGYAMLFLGKFTLDEDAEVELEAPLERVGPVQFVLTNPPLPRGSGIRLENLSGLPMLDEESSHFLSLRQGPESVPGLVAGDYRISSSLPDIAVEPSEIRLGADRSQPIELTWHPK